MAQRLSTRARWLIVTMAVTLFLSLPVAMWAMPHAKRIHYIGKLMSNDPAERDLGVAYVATWGQRQPLVVRDAIEQMPDVSNDTFNALVRTLMSMGMWNRETVGLVPYLRWVEALAESSVADTRIEGIQQLADLTGDVDDARLASILKDRMDDESPDVRLNALTVAAELAGATDMPQGYIAVLTRGTLDADDVVATEAWLILGLLKPRSGLTMNWRSAPPSVAKAMLYAAIATNPDQPTPAIEAALDPTVPPDVRQFAAWLLGMCKAPNANQALIECLSVPPAAMTDAELSVAWEAILAARVNVDGAETPAADLIRQHLPDPAVASQTSPLGLAAAYRMGEDMTLPLDAWFGPASTDESLPPPADPSRYAEGLLTLAVVEGYPARSQVFDLPMFTPKLVRAAAARASVAVTAEDLMPLLRSEDPAMRDLGCVMAVGRLSADEHLELARTLMTDFSDHAKMSGAMIAGMTGVQPTIDIAGETRDLLEYRLGGEHPWETQVVLRLAMWMQGRLPEMDDGIRQLFARDDLPVSTIAMGLMHMGRHEGFDAILSPRTDDPYFTAAAFDLSEAEVGSISLYNLLVQVRWCYVLEHYLPDDAPRLSPWSDPVVVAYQIRLLRDWYLINRSHFPRAAQ